MKTILLVEDNDDIRELVSTMLRREGYEVREAENGRAALDELKHMDEAPCLVLLDLMMPVMSGLELLRILHRSKRLAKLPVVVLSAIADQVHPEGASAYLRKPPSQEALASVLNEYCRQ